jgi:cytochrome c peroxidase|tara:strand:- start:98 stop:610 length:513 start_codon:yes stop_codon:yes gene_type:complete
VAKAIATFERTVVSGDSAFDRHEDAIEGSMTEAQIRGLDLFKNKARCTQCHAGFNFTDGKFHNIGVGWDGHNIDLGLFDETRKAVDMGKFKTPTVRDIANTGPYMHDGRFATLRQVIGFYDGGGTPNPFHDKEIEKLDLTEQEKQDLEDFLGALSGTGWQLATAPARFPQ